MRLSNEGCIDVAVVHGDPGKRQELIRLISKVPGMSVVALAPALVQVLGSPNGSRQIDVILIDADQPGILNNHAWAIFRSAMPLTRVVAFTSGKAAEHVESLLALGVIAALSIESPHRSIIRSIYNAARGVLDYEPYLVSLVKSELMYPHDNGKVSIGDLVIDVRQGTVERRGMQIFLTPIESNLIRLLAEDIGKVVRFEELYWRVWGIADGCMGSPDQLWSCVKRLRSKIESDPAHPEYIHSVRGTGYVLKDANRG